MLRLLVYIVLIFLVSAGLAWLAERPGDLVFIWQGYEIRTSLMVAVLALGALVVAILVLWWAIRTVVRAPRSFERYLGRRRRDRGYQALSDGMIAVGAGDGRAARKAAGDARALLGPEPLALLLEAQSAQLAGDAAAARTAFEALAAKPETRLLGLHGLYIEAERQGEDEAARHFAEQVTEAAPRIGWAGAALFEYQSRAGEWLGAMRTLEANVKAGTVDRPTAQRQRAALLTARAMEIEAGEPQEARAAALEAHRLAPDLAPAAVVASRLLSRAGDFRRAARVVEAAWRAAPHPDLAVAYAEVRPGDSARDRLKRIRRLNEIRANHMEGSIALARAALDARDFDAARAALDGMVKAGPGEAVCLLMAEIEARESADQGKVRMWLARAITAPRDPAWMADGQVFEHWAPVSPVSGRVGVFEWAVPAEAHPSRIALEMEAEMRAAEEHAIAAAPPHAPRIAAPPGEETAEPPALVEAEPVEPEPAEPGPEPVRQVAPGEPEQEPEERAAPRPAPAEAVADGPSRAAAELPEPPPAEAEPPADAVPAEPPPKEAPSPKPAMAGNGGALPASAAEVSAGKAAEPVIPRPPDDPGPLPEDGADEGARPRRFRLFGN